MDAKRDAPEGDRLDALVTLVEAWEARHADFPQPGQREEDDENRPLRFNEAAAKVPRKIHRSEVRIT